jgi:hypothetical protein
VVCIFVSSASFAVGFSQLTEIHLDTSLGFSPIIQIIFQRIKFNVAKATNNMIVIVNQLKLTGINILIISVPGVRVF